MHLFIIDRLFVGFRKFTALLVIFSFLQGPIASAMWDPDDEDSKRRILASSGRLALVQGDDSDEKKPLLSVNAGPEERDVDISWGEVCKIYGPYVFSKICIAANGIILARRMGKLGENVIEGEGILFSWEFLVMGTCMGGLRATSILSGALSQILEGPEGHCAVGNVSKTSTIITLLYGGLTIPLFLKADTILRSVGRAFHGFLEVSPEVLDQVQGYFNGFVWGAPATLLLYNDEQFSLGIGDWAAPGIAGSLYAGIAIACFFVLPGDLSMERLGIAMSIGANAAWLGLRMYYLVSPRYRPFKMYDLRTLSFSCLSKYSRYFVPLSASNGFGLFMGVAGNLIFAKHYLKKVGLYNLANGVFQQWEIVQLGFSSTISALFANYDPRKFTLSSSAKRKMYRTALFLPVGLTVFLGGVMLAFGRQTIEFFCDCSLDQKQIEELPKYLAMAFATSLASTFSSSVEAILHGVKDVGLPILVDIATDGMTLGGTATAAALGADPLWVVASGLAANAVSAVTLSVRLGCLNRARQVGGRLYNAVVQWTGTPAEIFEAFR